MPMVSEGEIIMQSGQLARALKRMSMQIIEDLRGKPDIIILGLNVRGFQVAQVIQEYVSTALGTEVKCLPLEIIQPESSKHSWKSDLGDNSVVLLVDDVLFSGTTMMKAIQSVLDHAKPAMLRIAVVIDRGHRVYPIQPDFVGLVSPTKFREHVEVAFDTDDKPVSVVLTGR